MSAAHGELLAAAARGDDEALAALVRAYHDRVYRFGLRVCRDGYDADDAVQEAFTKLARRPEVQRDASVLSWLMSVVRHACLRMLRPFVRERQPLGTRLEGTEGPASDVLDPQQALERWELIQSVHAAIAGLAPVYREVLIMRDLEGLSGEEVCRALGLELATMKTRLHRARSQLREELLHRGAWPHTSD
ncbi:ECF RNA polymerase sigma factor SigE [Myxococcus stipitatus]